MYMPCVYINMSPPGVVAVHTKGARHDVSVVTTITTDKDDRIQQLYVA